MGGHIFTVVVASVEGSRTENWLNKEFDLHHNSLYLKRGVSLLDDENVGMLFVLWLLSQIFICNTLPLVFNWAVPMLAGKLREPGRMLNFTYFSDVQSKS